MHLFKDYQLIADKLYKVGVDEHKHLLWKYGGVPAIDQGLWDSWGKKITAIRVTTNKGRKFSISKELFDAHKELINLGFGNQYVVDKLYWKVQSKQNEPELAY